MNVQEDRGRILKMSDMNEQMTALSSEGGCRGQGPEGHRQKPDTDGLPMESSPYVKYSDLEDYKRKGYGAEGHLQPKPIPAGSGTDAPTISGKVSDTSGALDTRAPRRNP